MGRWDHLDEDSIRVRANPRGSRPRTKTRPEHAAAQLAFVTAVDRGRYTLTLLGDEAGPIVTAMKARELGRASVVVGDHVRVVGDISGGEGTLARVVGVQKREHVLRRTADDVDPVERIIVAGASQLVIVCALADPEPRPRMIDRCLAAAFDARMTPIIALTKADRGVSQTLRVRYEALGVRVLVTSRDEAGDIVGLPALREALSGHISVLVGHSGVGKSTLVNALLGRDVRSVGVVNDVTGRGRHTSTSAIALRLPDDVETWAIDTPGVRSFGLAHLTPSSLLSAFPDLDTVAAQCPRGCDHEREAPDCMLDEWAELDHGELRTLRLDSFRRLLASLAGADGPGR